VSKFEKSQFRCINDALFAAYNYSGSEQYYNRSALVELVCDKELEDLNTLQNFLQGSTISGYVANVLVLGNAFLHPWVYVLDKIPVHVRYQKEVVPNKSDEIFNQRYSVQPLFSMENPYCSTL